MIPSKIPLRSKTVEHPFGTIKAWMGATHFKMKTMKHVATEMALHVLAYNMTRVIAILGVTGLVRAMQGVRKGRILAPGMARSANWNDSGRPRSGNCAQAAQNFVPALPDRHATIKLSVLTQPQQ